MPLCTIPGSTSSYWLVSFDKAGAERREDDATLLTDSILAQAAAQPPTHVFFFSHGWKGDFKAARDQYDRWIGAMLALQPDIVRMGPNFRPLFIGLHWPSLPFGQESFEAASFAADAIPLDEAREQYAKFFDEGNEKVQSLLTAIFDEQRANAGAVRMPPELVARYNQLADLLQYRFSDLDAPPDEDGVKFDPRAAFEVTEEVAVNFGGNDLETGLLSPLRQLSFWIMKKRARSVGEASMHDFVARLQNTLPAARFHLMGHSFGCIVVSGILGGAGGAGTLPRQADSLVLVQGAVSLWAYADKILLLSKQGYFNRTIRRPSVRGPIVTTRSSHDAAVGLAYPLAVGLAGQVSFDIGKILPPFGGIGTFGIQGIDSAQYLPLGAPDTEYHFQPGTIVNLNGSNFIHGHCDIAGSEVAHAIWQAALA